MTTVDPDTKLMLDFCAGDLEAFRRLVERNQAVVFKLAARYLGDAAEAEDVAQDVFLRVHGAARDYQPSAKFTTWVYRITVNVCLNRLRSAKARPAMSLEAGGEGLGEGAFDVASTDVETPSSRLERRELESKIREALDALPEAQRAAVLLRRFDELSYEQIAEVMETTVPAVKSLLSRARQSLKSSLSKYL
jgi:RNA polymerase sigma-70 factor, ECF subfamily